MSADSKRWIYVCQAPDCVWVSRALEDQLPEVAELERPCHPQFRVQERKVARFDCDTCRASGVVESGFLPSHYSIDDHGERELVTVAKWW